MDTSAYPTDRDISNYGYDITESSFWRNPEDFLKVGDKVEARFRIFDTPTTRNLHNWGPVVAEAGDQGTVVHVEEDNWPTVKFDSTGHSSCVTDFEVKKVYE